MTRNLTTQFSIIDELTVRSALAQLQYGVKAEKLLLIYSQEVADEAVRRFKATEQEAV